MCDTVRRIRAPEVREIRVLCGPKAGSCWLVRSIIGCNWICWFQIAIGPIFPELFLLLSDHAWWVKDRYTDVSISMVWLRSRSSKDGQKFGRGNASCLSTTRWGLLLDSAKLTYAILQVSLARRPRPQDSNLFCGPLYRGRPIGFCGKRFGSGTHALNY